MKEPVTKVIDTLTQEDFHETFQKLLERYNKFIAAGGDYFEGDLSFMCELSTKVPIRKSLETYLMILEYIYIYIYIYMHECVCGGGCACSHSLNGDNNVEVSNKSQEATRLKKRPKLFKRK